MADVIVELDRLSRTFGAQQALNEVTLRVERGSVFGLVGENGAGKTTLIRHVLGLLKAKQGCVRVFQLDPVKHPQDVLARIGYLSEDRELPDWMTIAQLMRYNQAFYRGWDERFAKQLQDQFELDPRQQVKQLSRGQRARAGLLIALAHRPNLLILDEPSSGLDPVVRRDILAAIIRTVADEGRTLGSLATSDTLTSVTVGVLASALIWAAFMAAALLILELRAGRSSFQSMIEQFESIRLLEVATPGIRLLGVAALGMGAIWGGVGLMTSLFLAGKKVSGVVMCTLFGVWIAAGIGPRLLLSREAQATFFRLLGPACVLLPLVCIAAAFVAGWWLKLISRNRLVLAAAIVAAMFAAAHLSGFTSQPGSYLPLLCGCCLIPSALAAAPLAVWWNRHR